MTDLYARYERLLFAYPREWRHHRGPEIAATYTEMAVEGQRWPRGRDAVSLLLHGLRTRLGRPGSRLIVPLTIVAMLIGGLCAAAAGARLGWGISTGLSARQVAQANQLRADSRVAMAPMLADSRPGTPALFAGYLAMPAWGISEISTLTGVYSATGKPAPAAPAPSVLELVDQQRARMTGTSWWITSESVTDAGATMTFHNGDLVARLDTSRVRSIVYVIHQPGASWVESGDGTITYSGSATDSVWRTYDDTTESSGFTETVYRTTPATVPVVMVLAGLLGAAITYLLIGWLIRRSSRLALIRQRLVMAGLTLTAALAAPAAVVCGAGIWTALRHHSDVPIRYWGGLIAGDVHTAALAAAILLVATIAGATLARPTWFEAEIAL